MTISSKRIFCKEMKVLSKKVYDFIDNVPSVQEESITEYLMWQWSLLDKKIKFIKHKKLHTKAQEAKTGADFEIELWIIKSTTAIPFLIQAKKIIESTKSYCRESLNYNIEKPIRQYQLLIDTAVSESMVPLYMFYTKQDKNKSIYIADADKVKKLAKRCFKKPKSDIVTRENILNISKNIINLFCLHKIFVDNNLSFQFEVKFNKLPDYVKSYLNNNTEQIHRRDVVILDLR